MNKQNQKINLIHSIIFFFISFLFSLSLYKFDNINISPIFCLMLILSIGISHGSLDNLKGKKLLNILEIKGITKFYLVYIAIALFIILIWLTLPSASLLIFLVVACYHFGKEDVDFLFSDKSKINTLLYFFKGLLIIVSPLLFHFVETVNIFKLLLVQNENLYLVLGFIEENKILYLFFILSLLANLFYFLKSFRIVNLVLLFDVASIIILNYFLSPLIAFTFYFCFLHSFRHSISLIMQLDSKNFKNGFFIFLNKALPLTILTAILYIISLYFLSNFYEINDAIIKIIFIGLASLTFPHILLEYLLEKNEK